MSAKVTEEGDLRLEVCDNGVGVSKEKLEEIRTMLSMDTENALKLGKHIGLQNVHSRIKLRYIDEKYGVTIKSVEEEGTTVSILTKAVINS